MSPTARFDTAPRRYSRIGAADGVNVAIDAIDFTRSTAETYGFTSLSAV